MTDRPRIEGVNCSHCGSHNDGYTPMEEGTKPAVGAAMACAYCGRLSIVDSVLDDDIVSVRAATSEDDERFKAMLPPFMPLIANAFDKGEDHGIQRALAALRSTGEIGLAESLRLALEQDL